MSKSSRLGVGSLIRGRLSEGLKAISGDLRFFMPRLRQLQSAVLSQEPNILDERFLSSFRRGEESAFDQLFRAYHAPLTFFANKFVNNETLAEDLVQECFVQLWERRRKLNNVQYIKAYLYRCVFNLCQRLPKEQRQPATVSADLIPDALPETPLIESEVLATILRLMEELPPRMQQVLRLFYLEEKSLADIGTEMGIDPETVRSHRYRAIQSIRNKIISG